MRLKRVRVFGFKTFADKTEFNLDGGVLAVIGSNGCGKSNLVDAILWGLGEGSVRSVRAQAGVEVIFSGSAKRKPIGFAEVTLIFDNEDGALPVESSEVSVTRRINRSGETEYLINRYPCRLKDVHDLLADTGLGKAGYSIVGQKEIDQALAASPEERRMWVDEAAGVQRYRQKKHEAQRRLTSALDHLSRVEDILVELETQREPLREEAEVAGRYKQALTSLQAIESGLLIVEIAKARRELMELEERVQESTRKARAEMARADELDQNIRQNSAREVDLGKRLDAARAGEQIAVGDKERAEADIRVAEERLRSLDALEESLLSTDAEGAVQLVLTELEGLRTEVGAENEALEQLRVESAGAEDVARELKAQLAVADKALDDGRAAEVRRLKLEAERSHRADRLKELRRELQGIDKSFPALQEAHAEAATGADQASCVFKAAQDSIHAGEQELQKARQAEDQESAGRRSLLAEKSTLEGRMRGIEATLETHEGLGQGARAVMDLCAHGKLKAMYRPVATAMEVKKELAVAIETALGGAAHDLIVDHEVDAKAAIQLLKEGRLGRATFQPIPLMRPQEPCQDLRTLLTQPHVLGRASELVNCEPRFRPVVDSLLGRVLVVENLDAALRLGKTSGWSRIVTLEGELVHSGGAVTGGATARQSYGLVQRKADLVELATQLKSIDSKLAAMTKAAEARERMRNETAASLDALRTELKEKQTARDEALQYARALHAELAETEKARSRISHDLERLASEKPEEAETVDVASLESARDLLLRKLAGNSAGSEQVEQRLREAEARLRQAQTRLEAAQRRLQSAEEGVSHREKRLARLGPEREGIRGDIVKHRERLEAAMARGADFEERCSKLIEARNLLNRERDLLAEEAKEARQNALVVGELAHNAEIARARSDSRRVNAAQRLLEEYGVSEDEAMERESEVEIPDDASQLVSRLRREIKAMGEVNVGAIEAFDRLTTRFDELSGQRADILGGIEQVNASIAELDSLTQERFETTFDAVRSAFSVLMSRLFGGGEGEMRLTDAQDKLESGIELDVTLPGKRRQRLELLSGGERALCAVAFLFALLQVRPSPLVVLDEVDAPLDGRNVERFTDVLSDFSQSIQFIVVTHNPTTIAKAPIWLGVTMQEPGVSILAPVDIAAMTAEPEPEAATSGPSLL